MITAKPVKRKFYNKWCYKLSLRCPGVGLLRYRSLEDIKDFLVQPYDRKSGFATQAKAHDNNRNMYALVDFLCKWEKAIYATRIESDAIDIYTNDPTFFNEASKECALFTWRRFAPTPQTEHLLTNEKRVLCKHLPHKKYQFKVFLTPHKLDIDDSKRTEFVEFVNANKDSMLISSAVSQWFMTTRWNWDRRYLFVDNEKTLLMLKLKNSDAVGAVYEYVTI